LSGLSHSTGIWCAPSKIAGEGEAREPDCPRSEYRPKSTVV